MTDSTLEQAYRQRLEEARRELMEDGWEVLPADRLAELPDPWATRHRTSWPGEAGRSWSAK